MPALTYGELRGDFPDFTEPHKKFLARLRRDVIANEIVRAYELGEVRLKSEDICQRPGFANSAEHFTTWLEWTCQYP